MYRSNFLAAGVALAVMFTAAVSQAVTSQDFDNPGTNFATFGNAAVEGAVTGNAGRITQAVNSQSGRISFADTSNGAVHSNVTGSFDFRANGTADGFSAILLPTGTQGTGTADFGTLGANEYGEVPGALAIGFNIHCCGTSASGLVNDTSANTITVSYGGSFTQVEAPFDISTPEFHNAQFSVNYGVGGNATLDVSLTQDVNGAAVTSSVISGLSIPGLSVPYEYRLGFAGRTGGLNALQQVDNIVVQNNDAVHVGAVQDFTNPGTGFNTFGTATVQGGPTGNFVQLTPAANSQFGRVGFDQEFVDNRYTEIQGHFDFTANGGADGLSFLLIPTTGADGQGTSGDFSLASAAEFAEIAGGIGIGFNIHCCGTSAGGIQDTSANTVYVSVDGETVFQIEAPIDISTADFKRAIFDLQFLNDGGAFLDLALVDDINGTPGAVTSVFNDLFLADVVPYEFRAGFAARTGGLNALQGVDNVFITVTPVPEPATGMLALMGVAGLVARRRRNANAA